MEERRRQIGELAKATGLTVRTLRHYDELGLLEPSERTEAGYRLYGEADVERLYTPDQLSQLEERRHALGEEGMRQAERDWTELIAAVEAERERGADPAAPRMQELAARWRAQVEAFTGGDAGIERSLEGMYRDKGVEQASHGMIDQGLMAYVG